MEAAVSEFQIRMDKETYPIGEDGRIDVWIDWDPPEAKTDVWACLDLEQQDPDSGKWLSYYHYDEAPLHDADPDEPASRTWWCHPMRSGRWGTFRIRATFFEPERHEIGEASVEFELTNP